MNEKKIKFKRIVKSDNFTIVDNKILKRNDMTARAKGVLGHILSLPDDWIIYKAEIFKHHKEGYDALNTSFKELEKLGYINHRSIRDKKGRVKRWDCEIYENPKDNPYYVKSINSPDVENPELDSPNLDKPEQDNPELLSTYSTNNLYNKELIDDDDINKGIKKNITAKILNHLKKAGIKNLTETKLFPLARAINKLTVVYKQEFNEAEKVILLAIEIYELNNGRSINYIISLLKDWENKELYNTQDIRKYIKDFKEKEKIINEESIEPVPMFNWLEEFTN